MQFIWSREHENSADSQFIKLLFIFFFYLAIQQSLTAILVTLESSATQPLMNLLFISVNGHFTYFIAFTLNFKFPFAIILLSLSISHGWNARASDARGCWVRSVDLCDRFSPLSTVKFSRRGDESVRTRANAGNVMKKLKCNSPSDS